ncbi:hypothetical protein GCM10023317_25610 [Actinopolymorpha pittospori]|uniref:Outer membrane protein assembly factor BamB n=1 Tax=Actinopolymorpha pittospori TaxID=648752 RepID=A0A927MU97_9ACTN|nr:outer membrane protein assembly factor BamB [Actinopolymorpha pittospori]
MAKAAGLHAGDICPALDASNGNLVWRYSSPDVRGDPTGSSPAIADGAASRTATSLPSTQGPARSAGITELVEGIISSPAISGETVYVGYNDGSRSV